MRVIGTPFTRFGPLFRIETHDSHTAIAFVAAGVAITVVPAIGATDLPERVVAVPIVRPTPIRSVHAIVRRSVEQTPRSPSPWNSSARP